MPTSHPVLPAPARPRRAPKMLPALLVFAMPVFGVLVLLPHTGRTPPRAAPLVGQSPVPGPWYGQQRSELAADLKGRIRLGVDKAVVKKQLGRPDWIRLMGTSPSTEVWSYWCRDTRLHFQFVNGQLQSEEALPYPTQ